MREHRLSLLKSIEDRGLVDSTFVDLENKRLLEDHFNEKGLGTRRWNFLCALRDLPSTINENSIGEVLVKFRSLPFESKINIVILFNRLAYNDKGKLDLDPIELFRALVEKSTAASEKT